MRIVAASGWRKMIAWRRPARLAVAVRRGVEPCAADLRPFCTDVDGNVIMDFAMHVASSPLGYNNSQIVDLMLQLKDIVGTVFVMQMRMRKRAVLIVRHYLRQDLLKEMKHQDSSVVTEHVKLLNLLRVVLLTVKLNLRLRKEHWTLKLNHLPLTG